MTDTPDPAAPPYDIRVTDVLEGRIGTELVDHLVMGDRKFRIGERTFRLAFLEECPDEWVDDETVVFIDVDSGDLFEVEVDVYVRKLHRPEPETEPVDPNQLTLDTTT